MMPIVSPGVRDAYFGSLDKEFEGFTFVDESAAEAMRTHISGSHGGISNLTAAMSSSARNSGAGATLMATSLKR